jgi:hypothetical protein
VMIAQLEQALNQVFGPDAGGEGVVESDGPNADGEY